MAWHACGNTKKSIVALVEIRNVGKVREGFLTALERVVDAVVVLEDGKGEGNVEDWLGRDRGKVAVVMRKTGDWVREELEDRQILLEMGRDLGGTHFVLLDYDEYIIGDCVTNGQFRKNVLQLEKGHALVLTWKEIWKNFRLERLLNGDRSMNFLTRRQIVVFADDRNVSYTVEGAKARLLGDNHHGRESSIHVLRCPRQLCGKPAKYIKGQPDQWPSNVKAMHGDCAIAEVRFINLDNIVVKAAWYETLGRKMGVGMHLTSGKMIERVFPGRYGSGEEENVAIGIVKGEWWKHINGFQEDGYNAVEIWRVKELLQWVKQIGGSDEGVLADIDLAELETAVEMVEKEGASLKYVPRRKKGSIAVVLEEGVGSGAVGKLLREMKLERVNLNEVVQMFRDGVSVDREVEPRIIEYEVFHSMIHQSIKKAMVESKLNSVFLDCASCNQRFKEALFDLLRREMPQFSVMVLFVSSSPNEKSSELLKSASQQSQQPGSHISVLRFPAQNLGSFTFLHWFCSRLRNKLNISESVDSMALLKIAEGLHQVSTIPDLIPITRLIFSLNAGRSGSKYLASILQKIDTPVISLHEPPCPSHLCSGGGSMRMQSKSLASSYEQRKVIKLPMIRMSIVDIVTQHRVPLVQISPVSCSGIWEQENIRDAAHKGDSYAAVETGAREGCLLYGIRGGIYAETNPNFKAWFFDVVLDSFPRIGYDVDVVVIRKYVPALVKSLYETGFFSERDGYNWMETSAGINTRVTVKGLADDEKLDAFDKLLSYVVNAEAVYDDVKRQYQDMDVNFVEIRSEELYGKKGTLWLLKQLGLEWIGDDSGLGRKQDKYGKGGKKRQKKTSLKECEQRTQQFINKYGWEGKFGQGASFRKSAGFVYTQ